VTGTLPLDRVLEWQGDHITTGCSLDYYRLLTWPRFLGEQTERVSAVALGHLLRSLISSADAV
jgi:hypothetical protein